MHLTQILEHSLQVHVQISSILVCATARIVLLYHRNIVDMLFVVIVPRRQQGYVLNAKRLDRSLKKQPWAMSLYALMGVEGQYP